jgi:hypothetical protein
MSATSALSSASSATSFAAAFDKASGNTTASSLDAGRDMPPWKIGSQRLDISTARSSSGQSDRPVEMSMGMDMDETQMILALRALRRIRGLLNSG